MKKPYQPEIQLQRGIYLVQSERVPSNFYEVNLKQGRCTCVFFSMKGRDCKHILAARQWEEGPES